MNISRRNFLAGAGVLGVSAAVSGCHTLPTEETMRKVGVAFGGATGLVLDQCDIDAEVRNTIILIVGKCRGVAPQEGETIWDAWMKAAKAEVADLVAAETLTKLQGELVLVAFDLVLKGLQLLVEKHPEVGTYCGLTVAAVGGFCDGFLAVYKPANGANGECPDCCEDGCCRIDVEAVKALRKSAELGAVRIKSMRVKTMALPRRSK